MDPVQTGISEQVKWERRPRARRQSSGEGECAISSCQQIERDRDLQLRAWIPLDWARGHLVLGEIEHCMTEAREFYHHVLSMQSPHAFRQANKLLQSLEEAGYGDFQAVKGFRNELRQVQTPHCGGKQLVEKDP